ncbi:MULTISPECIES: DHH family phosphoesterase [unclassified Streptococcus]|uniref:DHH family phosphoesterase n=1 Tax=unclassified Streptococcus TaxID=2608887 RepID=UPI00359EA527
MKKFRFDKNHLIMIGLICYGVLALGHVLVGQSIWFFFLLLGVMIALVGLSLYQKFSYDLSENEQVERIADQMEDNLATLLDQMPVGVVQFSEDHQHVTWFNPYAALLLTTEDGDFDANSVLELFRHNHQGTVKLGDTLLMVTTDSAKGMLYFWHTYQPEVQAPILSEFSPVIAVVSVDNYDDMTDNLADAEVSQINSFVANFISDFANQKKIFYRRTEMDRFYLFTDYLVLTELIEEKFALLEQFRQAAKELELGLTLSIGIAYGSHDYQDIGRVAQNNLNLAMVRGGDQVVVKENLPDKDVQYFGGGSTSTVKRSRTRTRAMMSAISEKIKHADNVFVVGHKQTDMDALAASVGMQVFASQVIDEAYAVYDPESMTDDVARAISYLKHDESTRLLTLAEAFGHLKRRSLLIMVDHSKLALTLSQEFYRQFREVIIVDHHRRDEDFPDNASLSFIETGASSASELVTELIQFQNAPKPISRLQASVLMAGIMLDTKNFSARVTSRTFDVASYLRRYGSDSVAIQTISAQNFDEYRQINQLIMAGQLVGQRVIIATGDENVVYTNTQTGKAADALLEMAGIEASFVITRTANGTVAISARSKKDINVQRLMERLGGGGHFNVAAAQLDSQSTRQVRDILLTEIEEITIDKE